jgi:hypothetical protein
MRRSAGHRATGAGGNVVEVEDKLGKNRVGVNLMAPVFEGASFWACLMRSVGYSVLVMPLIPLVWNPNILCVIRGLQFRVKHCRRGNNNPCIEL